MENKYDIFISYKREDKEIVFKLKDYIEKNVGVNCWIDLDGIESDAQFVNVIMNAIDKSAIFLFMYSHSHSIIVDYETDWTVREINYAQSLKKRIVFINIDASPLTNYFIFMFPTKQQVDATSEDAKNKLCKDLKKWLIIENSEIMSEMVAKPSLNKKKSSDIIADWLQKNNTMSGQNELITALFTISLANQLKTSLEKMKGRGDPSLKQENYRICEHEWHQVISNCKKDGQVDVLESDMIVEALDLEKLFDALLDKHVSVKVFEQVDTCRTIGDLEKLLVDK